MVSKKILFGMLAVALVFGMMAVSCDPEEVEKSIAISGITSTYNGKFSQVMVGKNLYSDDMDAGAFATISGGSVNFELSDNSGRYTGSGNHYIIFVINYDDAFAYAPGVSTINSYVDLKTYNIKDKNTSFSFSDFKPVPDEMVANIQMLNVVFQRLSK